MKKTEFEYVVEGLVKVIGRITQVDDTFVVLSIECVDEWDEKDHYTKLEEFLQVQLKWDGCMYVSVQEPIHLCAGTYEEAFAAAPYLIKCAREEYFKEYM